MQLRPTLSVHGPNKVIRGRAIRRCRRGVAATEMALVLPLLLLLALGATDFGRFAHTWIAVTNASRAGAGFGGTHPFSPASRAAWDAGVKQAVVQEMEGVTAFDVSRLSVVVTPQTDTQGRQRVAVQVTYPFQTLINWALLPSSFDLRQNTVLPMVR